MRALLVLRLLADLHRAVFVDDPATLAELEKHGAGLSERLGGAARWGSIAKVLEDEIATAARGDKELGVGVARHSHRLFDARWLRAATSRFELIGVANRMDRRPFHGCGEVRLIYRLAYRTQQKGVEVASRLPMTLALVYVVPDDGAGCRQAAARWLGGASPLELVEGAPLALVQVNLQLVRWPSAARPDLGGHAEYLLRAFRPDDKGERFVPAPLDNTPDVARLRKDKALRADLLAWLRDPANLARVDEGTAALPERFLAMRAISVTPRGLSRLANRLFRQVFSAKDVAGLPLAGRAAIGSPEALLRRLDDATCTGCHQARTIAGFHFLGVDPPEAVPANALAVPMSGHLLDEMPRRTRIVDALARGEPADFRRPFSERSPEGGGGYGAHCGRGDAGFAAWTCDAGLVCDAYDAPADDSAVGVCLPPRAGVGDPCEVGPLEARADARRDRVAGARPRACVDGACNTSSVGFPGGMCARGCAGLPGEGICGSIAVLTPFNECLARGAPFETCLRDNVRPAGLRACDARHACRDDYVCVRTGEAARSGACIPPYFLFQLRVDGHP